MLKKIAIILFILVAAVFAFAATKPATFQVRRVIVVEAPPEKVFALVNDFHNWGAWSPWEKLDPAMQRTYGGPARGQGASYAWRGNSKAGAGRMEIVESTPPSKVGIKLDFIEPFPSRNQVDFFFQPEGGATVVTWDMHGPSPYLSKLIQVFLSMDKMVGRDFERGLANLKAAAER